MANDSYYVWLLANSIVFIASPSSFNREAKSDFIVLENMAKDCVVDTY